MHEGGERCEQACREPVAEENVWSPYYDKLPKFRRRGSSPSDKQQTIHSVRRRILESLDRAICHVHIRFRIVCL